MSRVTSQRTYWMLTAVVVLIFSLGWGRIDVAPVQAELVPGSVGAGGLITHFHESGDGLSRVTIVDPIQRRMAVYHVSSDTGAISLKSVRNIAIDLQVQDYNSGDPKPSDMQKMLQRN